MVQTQGVADLLTRNQIPPCRCVVRRGIEIRVVELYGSLRNMTTAHPDLRDTQPAVIAIGIIANLIHAGGGRALSEIGDVPWNLGQIQDGRCRPIADSRIENPIPLARDIVAYL